MTEKHYLRSVIEEVDRTHSGLGRGVAMSMLVVKAHKLLLLVAPRGCGKSVIAQTVGKEAPHSLLLDRLSVAGLGLLKEDFTDFKGVVVVDDIAKSQTTYARISTITTLAELIYSHYIMSQMSKMQFHITGFHGSAIVNVQPVLLRQLVQSQEWEASIQDKTIRYYHLKRPLEPNPELLAIKLKWGTNFDDVDGKLSSGGLSRALEKTAQSQWGVSRMKEHLRDLLKASAALDNRETVTQSDYRLLLEILKPLQVEELVMDKAEFEASRFLHSNRLAILTEFLTYGQFTVEQLSADYKVSVGQAYRLMSEQYHDWIIVAKSPTTYAPSEKLREQLRRLKLI